MKKFEFRLDSALRWRNTQLQLEKARLQSLLGEQSRVTRDIETLSAERRGAVSSLQEMEQFQSFDLRSLASYLIGADLRAAQLQEQLTKRNTAVQLQQARVQQAELQVRLLEKLRTRKRNDWQVEFEKDLENNAAEAWLASHFGPSRQDA